MEESCPGRTPRPPRTCRPLPSSKEGLLPPLPGTRSRLWRHWLRWRLPGGGRMRRSPLLPRSLPISLGKPLQNLLGLTLLLVFGGSGGGGLFIAGNSDLRGTIKLGKESNGSLTILPSFGTWLLCWFLGGPSHASICSLKKLLFPAQV